jgi:outer membrane receptor for ferrienterochelin and colicin
MNTTVGYNLPGGKASLGLNMRYLPSIKSETFARVPTTTTTGAKAYSVFGLFSRLSINEKMELRAGIDNLFDKAPLVVEATPVDSNTDVTRAEYYDILGRRMYVGIKMSF